LPPINEFNFRNDAGDVALENGLAPWQLIRRAPRSVWLITALFGLIMAGWSVLAPLYHSPDEPQQADAVMRLEEGRGWSSTTTSSLTPEGVGAFFMSPTAWIFQHNKTYTNGTIAIEYAQGRHDRPTWQDLSKIHGTSKYFQQQIVQHPPAYHWYEAVLLRAGGAAGWRWDIAVSTMRLLSALLLLWLPLLAWATAWRITGSRLAGVCASIVPLAVPSLAQIGASVNNDDLLTLAGAATLLGVTCAMCGDRSKGCALWTGGWLTVALWTKAFALLLIPLVIVAYAAPWVRRRWQDRRSAPRVARSLLPDRRTSTLLGLSAGIAVLLGCWWYVVSEVRYGSILPPVHGLDPGASIGHDNWRFLQDATQLMLWRWWCDIGFSEIYLPWRLVIVATVVAGALGIAALLRSRGRRLPLLMLLWPTVATYFVVVGESGLHYLHTHDEAALAGRYLYIGFTGIAAFVGAGCAVLPRKLARWSPPVLLLAALGIEAEAVHLSIDRWWRPIGGTLRQAWNAFSSWSTWPVGVLWTGIALLALAAVGATTSLLVDAFRSPAARAALPSEHLAAASPASPPAPSLATVPAAGGEQVDEEPPMVSESAGSAAS
jgi:small subunit ribosomal protein S36